MEARNIFSLVFGGMRIFIRSWQAMRWGQRQAKKGAKVFKQELVTMGMPIDVVESLKQTYYSTAEFLSFRRIAQFAIQGFRSGQFKSRN